MLSALAAAQAELGRFPEAILAPEREGAEPGLLPQRSPILIPAENQR
ncbi:MAG: hypothetical protein Q8N18_23690 [Opitutaceae bacterium]|nr:hypothetical protein [Opitutaceae bacterium]